MLHPRVILRAIAVTAGTSLVALSAPAIGVAQPSLTVTARGTSGTTVSGTGQFTVAGDTAVDISVAHLSGGNLSLVAGPSSALPSAVAFPAYVASGTYPRAVLRLDPTSGTALDPGDDDFTFGAVFRLDQVSSSRTIDNGDNIFQRGTSADTSMFKLEIDGGRPACKVTGSQGELVVRSTTTVSRNTWYKASCSRVGSKLTVSYTPYAGSGTAAATAAKSTSGSGSVGTLSFPTGRAASIGGKLDDSGAVMAGATDQFNGDVAQVWVTRP